MKVIGIYIKNTKCIELFNCTCDGHSISIAGDTATGKTTAVSSLWNIMKKQGQLLKNGAKSGDIKITIGDGKKIIIAHRHMTKSGNSITISRSGGQNITQKDFQAMISELSVNPHKITDMRPKERVNTLLKAANLGDFDLDATDKEIAELEEQRLVAHRKIQASKPGIDEPEKVEAIDISDLYNRKRYMEDTIRSNKEKRDKLEQLRDKIEELKSTLAELESKELMGSKACASLSDPDVSVIDKKIEEASSINEKATLYKEWKRDSEKYESAKTEHSNIEQQIKEMRDRKKEALDNAQWPIDGLTIEDGDILYNGVSINHLGNSEQMLVCAALAIEDIKNHPIRVVRMDGIESMSEKDFNILLELYDNADIQVLSTRVARSDVGDDEIEIIDGIYEDEKEWNDVGEKAPF